MNKPTRTLYLRKVDDVTHGNIKAESAQRHLTLTQYVGKLSDMHRTMLQLVEDADSDTPVIRSLLETFNLEATS